MNALLDALQHSVTGKVLFVGTLALVLLIPVGMIRGLIFERAQRYEEAREDIARGWGGPQIVGGPILIVPFAYTRLVNGTPIRVRDELYVLPQELDLEGGLEIEERTRGIYSVPVYTARLRVTGAFAAPAVDGGYEELELRMADAELALPIADARAIREPIELSVGQARAQFRPGGERVPGFGSQLVLRYADLGLAGITPGQSFSFDLVLGGTRSLHFLPLGAVTSAQLRSTWPSPSFGGAQLPAQRDVSADGFTAQWRVLDVARGIPATFRKGAVPPHAASAAAFGVELMTPLGVHEATLRAVKHAVLIVALTFAAYFLFEVFAALRLHALQYLFVGAANCTFYVLLLALAEHFGFGTAYAASAVAAVTLIGTYSATILRGWRRSAPLVGLLAVLYGYLYVTLKAEDYALLFGALGLFVMLASLMYVTRRVDWYTLTPRAPDDAGTQRAGEPPAPAAPPHA